MAKIDTSTPDLLKHGAASTETLDGFSDEIGVAPERKRKLSKTKLIIFLFVLVFLIWVVLFLGLTMYQIKTYQDDIEVERKNRVGVRENRLQAAIKFVKDRKYTPTVVDTARDKELKWAGGEDPRTKGPVVADSKVDTAREKELKRAGGEDPRTLKGQNADPQPPKPSPMSEEVKTAKISINQSKKGGATVRYHFISDPEMAALEARVESFTKPDSFVSAERYSDVKAEKIAYNCYRKDFYRTNINGTGTNCRFIAKIAHIPRAGSSNKGECATSYFWIYNNPQTKKTLVYSMGPYYGDHHVVMREALFDKHDPAGEFTLFGCAPPVGPFKSPQDLLDKEYYYINELATITPGSYKFNSFAKFYQFLDERGRFEMADHSKEISMAEGEPDFENFFRTMKEASSCLNSL